MSGLFPPNHSNSDEAIFGDLARSVAQTESRQLRRAIADMC